MFKSIKAVAVAGVVAVMASSAFASWDYFPPKEEGGEAKVEFGIGFPAEDWMSTDLMVGARYTVIRGLELSLKVPMELTLSYDGESMDDYFGIYYMPFGVRYWLMDMGLGFFVDAFIPLGTADWMGDPEFDMDAGIQYSMEVNDAFSFGSELKFKLPLIDGEDFGMALGVEAALSFGAVSPYLGLELDFGLEDYADADMVLWVGAGFDITESIGAYAEVGFDCLLSDYDVGTRIAVGLTVNF